MLLPSKHIRTAAAAKRLITKVMRFIIRILHTVSFSESLSQRVMI